MAIKRPDRFSESLFANLCDREGVSCTRVHHDDKGWDFFIEFGADEGSGLPADMRPAPLKCLVQIKSVSKGAYRTKLSNALAFSKSELPCFVVAFILERGGSDPVGAVVHHHWFDEIKASLLRARELHAKGRDDTNHFFLTRRASRREAIDPLNVLATIKETAKAYRGYSAEKMTYAETVGYEDAAAVGNVTLKLDSEEDFIDLHIGLKESVEMTRLEISNQRFGIRSRVPMVVEGPGRLSISVDPKPCTLTVRPDNISLGISFDAKLYTPAIPRLTPDKFKFRVMSKFVELIASSGSCTFNVRWDGGERYNIDEMAQLVNILTIAMSGEFDFVVKVGGNKVFGASGPAGVFPSLPHLDVVKTFLERVRTADERQPGLDASISLASLYERIKELHEFNGLSQGDDVTIRFKLTSLQAIPDTGALLYTHGIELGDWVVMGLVRRSYKLEVLEDGMFVLHLNAAERSLVGLESASTTDIETRWEEELRRAERVIREREGVSAILIANLHMMGKEL